MIVCVWTVWGIWEKVNSGYPRLARLPLDGLNAGKKNETSGGGREIRE
jgi:hypothetical protein